MALASTLNPLSTRHSVLPPQIVLLAKVVVVAAFFKGYAAPRPSGVAFFDVLEGIPPQTYGTIVSSLIVVGGLLVLLNLATRTGAFCVGVGLLSINLGNMAIFAHGGLFASMLLILSALWTPSFGSLFLRLQLAVLYCGAGLSKVFDGDWWSGQYLSFYLQPGAWASPPYAELLVASGLFPFFALALSVMTIVLELAAAGALLIPKTAKLGVLFSCILHVGILLGTGFDYGIFLYSVLASYLAFVEWPPHVEVEASTRGAERRWLDLLARLDGDGVLRVSDSDTDSRSAPRVKTAGLGGSAAWTYILLRFPPALLLLQLAIVWPNGIGWLGWTRALIVAALCGVVIAPVAIRWARAGERRATRSGV